MPDWHMKDDPERPHVVATKSMQTEPNSLSAMPPKLQFRKYLELRSNSNLQTLNLGPALVVFSNPQGHLSKHYQATISHEHNHQACVTWETLPVIMRCTTGHHLRFHPILLSRITRMMYSKLLRRGMSLHCAGATLNLFFSSDAPTL